MDGRRRALIVAIDSYQHEGLRQLRSPAADAAALADVLADPDIGDFDVRVLRNAEAHVIAEQIEDLFSDNHRDDVLLLHLSCHGLKSESGALFFAATNTRPNRLATAVAADFVQRCMRSSRSKSIVLFLDCCYGGAFGQGVQVRAAGDVNVADSFPNKGLGGGRGRAVISASSAMEYAFEGEQLADNSTSRPSLFTAALVEGLATGTADLDGDGWVSLDELYEFVFDKVQERNPNQTPTRDIEMQGDLLLAKAHRQPAGPVRRADDSEPGAEAGGTTLHGRWSRRARLTALAVATAGLLLGGSLVWWYESRAPSHLSSTQFVPVGPWPTAVTADSGRIYVVNCGLLNCAANSNGSVSVLDPSSHALLHTIAFPTAPPRDVAIGAGNTLYVSTNGAAYRVDAVSYAKTALNLVDPGVLVTVPATNRRYAYFAQPFTGVLTTFDTQTGGATRTEPAGLYPSTDKPPVLWGCAARPDGSEIYLSSPLKGTVYVRNADGTAARQYSVPRQPWGLALAPDQKTLWIAVDSATANGAKEVDALDLASGQVARVALPGVAHGVYLPATGHFAYVTSEASQAVYLVDTAAAGHPVSTVALGRPGYGMAFSGSRAWAANGPAGSVAVFDMP